MPQDRFDLLRIFGKPHPLLRRRKGLRHPHPNVTPALGGELQKWYAPQVENGQQDNGSKFDAPPAQELKTKYEDDGPGETLPDGE